MLFLSHTIAYPQFFCRNLCHLLVRSSSFFSLLSACTKSTGAQILATYRIALTPSTLLFLVFSTLTYRVASRRVPPCRVYYCLFFLSLDLKSRLSISREKTYLLAHFSHPGTPSFGVSSSCLTNWLYTYYHCCHCIVRRSTICYSA